MDEYLKDVSNFSNDLYSFEGRLTQAIAYEIWEQYTDTRIYCTSKDRMIEFIKYDLRTKAMSRDIDDLILGQVNFNKLWTAVEKMEQEWNNDAGRTQSPFSGS